MRFQPLALAASFVFGSSAFTASFAQSAAVSEHSFDWIFFAIVGIPFVIVLVDLFRPDVLERMIRERDRSGFDRRPASGFPPRHDRPEV